MTAFAQMQKDIKEGQLSWEIKSVNHRYLDVSFRVPDSFRFIENHLRHSLRNKISRGKLDCQLKFQPAVLSNQSIHINMDKVNLLIDLSNQLATSYHLANDLSISTLFSWPGVLETHEPKEEHLKNHVISLFEETVEQLITERKKEGSALKLFIEERLNLFIIELESSKSIVTQEAGEVKNKLLTRLQQMQFEVQESRLEQEIALILTRMDVSEELDRLENHAAEVNKALNCAKITGRRLDFLMQELNREANTLSSKSSSLALTQRAVEMKVLIEQMREQIQNIE